MATTMTTSSPARMKQDDFERIARETRSFRDSEKKRIENERLAAQSQKQQRKRQEYERITRQYLEYMKQQEHEINQIQDELKQLRRQQLEQKQQHQEEGVDKSSSPSLGVLPPSPSYVAERAAQLQQQLEEVEERYQLEKKRFDRHEQQKKTYDQKYLENIKTSPKNEHVASQQQQRNNDDEENRVNDSTVKPPSMNRKSNDHVAVTPLVDNRGIIEDIDSTKNERGEDSSTNRQVHTNDSGRSLSDEVRHGVEDGTHHHNNGQYPKLVRMEEQVQRKISESDDDLAKAFDQVDDELKKANRMMLRRSDSEDEDRLAAQKYGDLMARDLSVSFDTTSAAPSMTESTTKSGTSTTNIVELSRQQVESELKGSDNRTQEMVDEDDFLPKIRVDRTRGQKSKDGRSLILHEFTGLHRQTTKKDTDESSGGDKFVPEEDIIIKTASFELPMEVTDDGIIMSPNIADLSMVTTIPPSRLGGRWSGTLEGKSSFGRTNATATGLLSLEYITSRFTRLTLGTIRGGETSGSLVSLGGRYVRNGTSIGVTLFNPFTSMQRLMFNTVNYSLSISHSFPKSKWIVSSSVSQKQDLSMVVSNTNLSARMGFNLWDPKQMMMVRLDAKPKLSEYRRAHCYCQWKTGIWQFGVSLVQSLQSDIATVGMGWRFFSSRGFEWVISWTRGTSTVRIPVLISKGFAGASFGYILYCTFISHILQDGIAELWSWSVQSTTPVSSTDAAADGAVAVSMSKNKQRKDAELQVELMKRQAMRKAKNEAERDGLVIRKAMYNIKGGDEWEVTIPVQFWVSQSTLTLPRGAKATLLGFYDVAVTSSEKDKSEEHQSKAKASRWSSVLRDAWNDLLDIPLTQRNRPQKPRHTKKTTQLQVPTLTVEYMFRGDTYIVTIKDNEELILPSPAATKLNDDSTSLTG